VSTPCPSHHPVFERFEPWSGEVEVGFSANFLGVRTRDAYNLGWPGFVLSQGGWVETRHPPFDEDYFEWIDVLEAVVEAEGVFTMIELGAGWGRWLLNGAEAARRRGGLRLRLVGVEAEPTHFRWLEQHVADNRVDPSGVTLIEAAVARTSGHVRFQVGDPDAWYGQSIVGGPAARATGLARLRSLGRRPPAEPPGVAVVDAVTLAEILEPLDRVDLIDLDVQGVEADVLEAAAEGLDHKVQRVHVGTHGEDNELRLRALFESRNWECRNDYPCGRESTTPWGRITFQDGVQTWINRRLA
jgi:FkbM family methyltransferase